MSNSVLNIFVQPEYAGSFYINNLDIYNKYMYDLKQIANSKDTKTQNILIRSINSGNLFYKLFNSQNRFETIEDNNGYNLGELSPKEWEKFENHLNENNFSSYKIHGSFYGRSTLNFILQLSSFLTFNEPLFKNQNSEKYLPLLLHMADFKEFENFPIKYGVSIISLDSKSNVSEDIAKQFLDSKSRIYGRN